MKSYRWLVWLVLICCVLLPGVARAQAQMPVRLLAATFDPVAAGEPQFADEAVQAATQQAPPSPYYLVQFSGPVEATWLQQVAALGGEVLGYVPENTHVVRASAANLAKISALPTVRWVGAYQPGYKLAPVLGEQLAVLAANAGSTVKLVVVSFPGEPLAELTSWLQTLGVTVQSSTATRLGGIWEIEAPVAALPTLIQHPAVSWVEPYVAMQIANAEGRKIMGAETIWQEAGYFGAGQIIAISDSGLSVQGNLSPDFGNRLIRGFAPSEMNIAANCRAKTSFTDINGHGTHVAGSVLGSGARSGSNAGGHQYTTSHAGVAPEAQFVFMALNTDGSTGIQCIDPNGDFIAKGYQLGARISTNSWGASDRGGYNVNAAIVDDYIWQHKDYLVLFSAGNAGPGASTVGSPGTAKNILTVGASENNRPNPGGQQADNPNSMTNFSSRGPTQDGRIKPDVVAPGSWILSVRAPQILDPNIFWGPFNDDYAYMGGTSMATPLTAGAAALTREWLNKERNLPNPSAALLKAVLINGATQLPGLAAINNDSGRGRVDLKNTLRGNYAILDDHVQGLTTGQSFTYSVRIVATTTVGSIVAAALPPALVQTAAASGFALEPGMPPVVAASTVVTDATALSVQALPGHASGRSTTAILSTAAADKSAQAAQSNPLPPLPHRLDRPASARFQPASAESTPEVTGYWYNMVGGGDFEDPAWSDFWVDVWLGLGVPERTTDPSLVLEGEASMWLGGTESADSIWYPVHFPDSFDTANENALSFSLGIFDQDLGNDIFCVALVDTSGYFIGPYAPDKPDCTAANDLLTYKATFSAADLEQLAGQSGYLVLYTESDGAEPHMSAIVDEIVLSIDIPDIELGITPKAGPPGTTFLLTGAYHIPYSRVNICIAPCSTQGNYIKSVYADAKGNIAAFLYSFPTTLPGQYAIETQDCNCRQGSATLTIGEEVTATLQVDPTSGPPGTKFNFTGASFQPNDNQIRATLGNEELGTVSSNDQGAVAFSLTAAPSIPAGSYTLTLTDSSGRSATATFSIVAPQTDAPGLTVTPASGPPGTNFSFTAQNFTPAQAADLLLGGQVVGQLTPNDAGGATFNIQTKTDIAPGKYTVTLRQGAKQAAAEFEVTTGGGGENPQSGNGLYVTLTWTDPPVRSGSAVVLVNDLDLIIDGPNGRVFGNGGASANRRDNVESIRLENPPVGQYVITVLAERVNGAFGAQPYALVATTKQRFEANATNLAVQVQGNNPGFQIYLPNVGR